jgi:hypothetical protein
MITAGDCMFLYALHTSGPFDTDCEVQLLDMFNASGTLSSAGTSGDLLLGCLTCFAERCFDSFDV